MATWILMSVVVAIVGCGEKYPKLGLVSGNVTLDGNPEADLLVTYEPQLPKGVKTPGSALGGTSSGITDAGGNFELKYRGGLAKGAVIGKHLVRITSAKGGGPAGGDLAEKQITIPGRYNAKSTLEAEVKEGKNDPKTFELTSKPDVDRQRGGAR